MLSMSYIGDHVWLMTSRQTEPELTWTVSKPFEGWSQARDSQLVDIGVEDAVDEADTRTLIRVRIWQFNVHLPDSAFKGCCRCRVSAARCTRTAD